MLFKSVAKGLPGGSERIPVGFGKVRLRSGLAALAGEMLGESTMWKEQAVYLDGCRCGYGLIPDRGPNCGRRQSLGMAAPGYVHIVDGTRAA